MSKSRDWVRGSLLSSMLFPALFPCFSVSIRLWQAIQNCLARRFSLSRATRLPRASSIPSKRLNAAPTCLLWWSRSRRTASSTFWFCSISKSCLWVRMTCSKCSEWAEAVRFSWFSSSPSHDERLSTIWKMCYDTCISKLSHLPLSRCQGLFGVRYDSSQFWASLRQCAHQQSAALPGLSKCGAPHGPVGRKADDGAGRLWDEHEQWEHSARPRSGFCPEKIPSA